MIKLICDPYNVVIPEIDRMMGHEKGIKEIFYSKRDRLDCSVVAALIFKDNEQIGFINVVSEGLDNILFIDEGIIEKYRGHGYGREALKILIKLAKIDEFLICETKDTNILANSSAEVIGKSVYSNENRKFYLVPKERATEFLESGALVELHNHVSKQKTKRLTK